MVTVPRHAPEGILVVDKPVGPTSFDVVHKLRKSLGTREIGHCGTLDPLASGVVVVCVGRYTRLARFLTADDKHYRARVTFGFSTPSLDLETAADAWGDPRLVDEARVRAALAALAQQKKQRPPLHSAVQKDGERLYQKARRGEVVEVDARDVVVHALALVSLVERREGDVVLKDADIDVHVGKGFFVRALARDLGVAVGCPAHLSALRRTQSGAYSLSDAVSLEEARDPATAPRLLRRGADAVRGMPILRIDAATARALRWGQQPPWPHDDASALLAAQDEDPVAVVDVQGGRLVTVRGF